MLRSGPGRARAAGLAAAVACAVAVTAPARAAAAPASEAGADPIAERYREVTAELHRDRGAPGAFARVAELASLEDELPDLAPLAADYARVAEDGAAHPAARALARFRLAAVARARGDVATAGDHLRRLRFLDGWWIAGPFDDPGKRGFDTLFGPETGGAPRTVQPGKDRDVGWRPLAPEATSAGFTHLGAVVRPARDVAVFAATRVASPRARRAWLLVGASGALQVFVNGEPVYGDRAYHVARLDQAAVPVRLRAGNNRVLLKISHAEGRLGFYARLADDAPRGGRRPAAPDVIAQLERLARAARGGRARTAQYDLAVAVAERRPGDDSEQRPLREARRAVELAPTSIPAALLAARLEPDPNRRRAVLERALAAHPDAPRLLVALGTMESDARHLVAARRLLERARAVAPRYVAARLALATVWDRAGFAGRARLEREAIARDHPTSGAARVAAAGAARAQDRLDDAVRHHRAALALRQDDAASRASLVELLADRGDVEGAAALLREGLRLAPADVDARARLAELSSANGRHDEAEAEFAEALRISPDEEELRERRGQARLRAGRTADALQDLAAALELRPQNARLKELVRAIEPARERFEEPYLLDARALAADAAAGAAAEGDAVVLGELRVTRVFPSGLASRYTQLVVQVRTDRGADAWRTWSASYSPDRQELRIDRARVLKPDGTWVEAFQESDRSASEPWYRLYYDERLRQLSFPALARGDVLEIAVRTDDVAAENLLADSFGELVFLSNGTPKRRMDYVLLVPVGRRIHANEAQAGVTRTERPVAGGLVEHRWTARALARIRGEPGLPGWIEIVPYVHVSTYASWDDVARFYGSLVREPLTPGRDVRALALRLAAEVRASRRERGEAPEGDERAIVEAVHRFVVTNTRYVGLEFGIHGYRPYRVDDVLQRRFGDCKDKASLAHALLASLGIDARLVLLRMRSLGVAPPAPASLAIFNHAVLYVPRLDLWLDGTASYAGARDLPAEDRGATALVIEPDGRGRFTTLPEGRPEENATATAYDVALSPDGAAVVTGEARVRGVNAPAWRRAYAAGAERYASLEHATARTFPGARVRAVTVSDLARLEDEVTVRFSLAIDRLAEQEGGALRVLPFGPGHRYLEALAPLSERRYDLVLAPPSEARLTCRYRLPRGYRAALPPPERLERADAAVEVTYRPEEDGFVAEARFVTRARRVAAPEYPAFRDFLARADAAFARPVRIARAAP